MLEKQIKEVSKQRDEAFKTCKGKSKNIKQECGLVFKEILIKRITDQIKILVLKPHIFVIGNAWWVKLEIFIKKINKFEFGFFVITIDNCDLAWDLYWKWLS